MQWKMYRRQQWFLLIAKVTDPLFNGDWQVGGSTRCWKVGEPVLLAKDKNHPLAVVPLVFLRGSGPKAKHRVVLYAPTPSAEFASLDSGDACYLPFSGAARR